MKCIIHNDYQLLVNGGYESAIVVSIPCPWYCSFCAVRTPGAYQGSLCTPSRFNHAAQVKGERPDKIRHPGPPVWRLGVRRKALAHKKAMAVEATRFKQLDQ